MERYIAPIRVWFWLQVWKYYQRDWVMAECIIALEKKRRADGTDELVMPARYKKYG